jgi:hypothetical protein
LVGGRQRQHVYDQVLGLCRIGAEHARDKANVEACGLRFAEPARGVSACTASGTREGSGLLRELSIHSITAARERNSFWLADAAIGASRATRMAIPDATDA